MKKSIKYAGVAAATLLAVAPVAAPVLGQNSNVATTNVAKASTFSTQTQEDAYNAFDSTFKDYNNSTQADFKIGAAAAGLEQNNRLSYTGLAANGIVKPLHPQYQNYLNDVDVTSQLDQIVFVVVPANGQSFSDWKNSMIAAGQKGGSVSYRIVGLSTQDVKDHLAWSNQQLVKNITPVSLNGHALDKTVTAKTSNVLPDISALNISFDTPVDGYVGEAKDDFRQNGKYPVTVKDNLGNTVDPSDITSTFYNGLDPNTLFDGNTLPKAGTVTQKITLKFNRNEYPEGLKDLDQVTVNGNAFQGGLITKFVDKLNNSITLTRTINVGLDNYTDTTINGQVHTPVQDMSNNTIVTHLYDSKGNQVASRGLSQGTDWFTDTKRVNNATGETYYRVSTNEWVKASDVSYSDNDTDTNNGGDTDETTGLTNVTALPAGSTVSLAGPAGFVYSLYGKDGSTATRGLAGDSAWSTDQQATDAAGNTYYRVSTDEWIMAGTGVTLN